MHQKDLCSCTKYSCNAGKRTSTSPWECNGSAPNGLCSCTKYSCNAGKQCTQACQPHMHLPLKVQQQCTKWPMQLHQVLMQNLQVVQVTLVQG